MQKWGSWLLVLTLWGASVQAAEVMYITDKLYLGLYSEKGDKGKKLKTLVSGSKLFIDKIEGRYAQVETDQGLSGWVKKRFLVEKPPAIVQLKRLQAEQGESVGQVIERQSLQSENRVLKEKIALLEQSYAQSQQKTNVMQSELEQLKQSGDKEAAVATKTAVKTEVLDQDKDKEALCAKSATDDSEVKLAQELLELKQKMQQAVTILSLNSLSTVKDSEDPLITSLKNNQMIGLGALLLLALLSFFVGAKWVSWRIRSKLGGDLVW